MADPKEMEQGEQQEDQALQQILQLCQSGNPQALQQIAQIVQQLIAHNQQEEQEMGGGQGGDMASRVMDRLQANKGGEQAPAEQGE